jgi:hypothetical protein
VFQGIWSCKHQVNLGWRRQSLWDRSWLLFGKDNAEALIAEVFHFLMYKSMGIKQRVGQRERKTHFSLLLA